MHAASFGRREFAAALVDVRCSRVALTCRLADGGPSWLTRFFVRAGARAWEFLPFRVGLGERCSSPRGYARSARRRELAALLRVGGMSDAEARQLPVAVDAATLRSFGSSKWTTDAGPLDVLSDLLVSGGRRTYDDLFGEPLLAECTVSFRQPQRITADLYR